MKALNPIPSVNFHLWKPCNMRCRFCFATFHDINDRALPKGHLGKQAHLQVLEAIAPHFSKINFAGGEPMLCPWLDELIVRAKALGLTTSIVTNGSRITEPWLAQMAGHLDWIGLSIDSADPAIQQAIGRAVAGKQAYTTAHYLSIAAMIRQAGIRLKINTVVCSLNWQDDMREFIGHARPERWKLFQALPVDGQNDGTIDPLLISAAQFAAYHSKHSSIASENIQLVAENNELMTGSYVMIDPAGRFFDDTHGRHTYSRPIMQAGAVAALMDIRQYPDRFESRGGRYDW